MPDDGVEAKETPAKTGWNFVFKAVGILLVSLAGFVASLIWKGYEKIEASQESISTRLEAIELDTNKWKTLLKHEDQIFDLRVRLEVMRQVWSYEYGRQVPTGFPSKPGKPVLVPPAELFRDIENYRNIQRQMERMPVPQKR